MITALLALAGVATCAQAQASPLPPTRASKMAELRRSYACVSSARMRITARDPMVRREACWLVAAALQAVADGKARHLGVPPTDTADARAADVTYHAPSEDAVAGDEAQWQVAIRLPKRCTVVAVSVSQTAPTLTTTVSESPTVMPLCGNDN